MLIRAIKSRRKRWIGDVVHVRWEDSIRMDLRKTALGGGGWIHMAQDRDQ
jgi:hypothetical protein